MNEISRNLQRLPKRHIAGYYLHVHRLLSTLIILMTPFFGCGEPEPASIRLAWSHQEPSRIAEAISGPEDRVLIMLAEQAPTGSGMMVTLDGNLGDVVEGPFDVPTLTEQAPIFVGANIFAVSKVGKIEKYNLAGQNLSSFPMLPIGSTGPIGLDGSNSVRLASSVGTLYSFDLETGEQLFQTPVDEAIDSPIAIASDGTSFVASPLGRLEAIDRSGQKTLSAATGSLASGTTLVGDKIVIGHSNGVDIFSRDGTQILTHSRASAVLGTSALPNGNFVAWGQDGVVEVLTTAGDVVTKFRTRPESELNPPTISVAPAALDRDYLLVVDDLGEVYLVDVNGNVVVTYNLETPPRSKSRINRTEKGTLLITTATNVYGLRVTLPSD